MFARTPPVVTVPAAGLPGALRLVSWTLLATAILMAAACVGPSTPGQANGTFVPPDSTGNPNVNGADGTANRNADTGGGGQTDEDANSTSGTDATTSGGDATTGNGGAGGPKPSLGKFAGYPSNELRLRIVGPSGRGHAVVSGSIVEVAGVLFGGADEVTWSTDTGGTGSAHGAPFFQTDPITLVPGDNLITVTAKNATESVTDTLVVTYNPAFTFQDRLRANPRVAKVGKSTAINAVMAIGKATNVVKGSVKLMRVDDQGNTLTTFGEMIDDGNLGASGDEIKGDGLYSRKITVNDSGPGVARLRASVQVQVAGQSMTAYSDVVLVDVVQDITGKECDEAVQALASAKTAAASGGAKAAADALKGNAAVAEAGEGVGGAWVRFKSGLLGSVSVVTPGNRGGSADPGASSDSVDPNLALSTVQVASKRALLLDPFAQEFGADEVAGFGQTLAKLACPAYTLDQPSGTKADLRWFRRLFDYGIVALASHGDVLFGSMSKEGKANYDWRHQGNQEVLWTGHAVSCGYFGSSGAAATTCTEQKACGPESECILNATGGNGVCVDHLTADLRRGRVVMGSDGTYGVLPAFIKRHAEEPFPRSLIYLGTCRSLWNGSMAGELFAAGAAAVAGFNGTVQNGFATNWGLTFLKNIGEQKKLSGVAHVQIEDPFNAGTYFQLVGAQNLDAFFSGILNPSWETGSIQGWIKSGDGRVISRLGSTVPVAGKFMGIISTGLGYTAQTGKIEQRFCIPAGKTKFSFWWKYYSEEFKEYCGSQFQDAFTARFDGIVAGKSASITAVTKKVDDICNDSKTPLTPADVAFDQGGVFMTQWQESVKDISPFAGNGNVLLSFFATDVGDSVFDTAVLFDKVDFE